MSVPMSALPNNNNNGLFQSFQNASNAPSSNIDHSSYLNSYWQGIQQQGHTQRTLLPGEDSNTVRQQEASTYGIDPSQVQVLNSGGKTYFRVPWNLAANHANQASVAGLQVKPQQQQSGYQDPMDVLKMLGYDPTALMSQAQQMYNQQAQQYQGTISTLQQEKKAEEDLLNNQLNEAVNTQNDTSFQDWLKAREGIASRGLANSGFLNDAMVRNQLNNQDKMQGIYTTAMDNQQKADASYQNQIMQQQQALAGISPAQIYDTLNSNELKTLEPLMQYYMPNAYQQGQLGIDTAKLTGMYGGMPTITALNAGGYTYGYNPQTGGFGLVPTETAQNNQANLQLNYNKLALQQQVAEWNQQDKVSQIAIQQGQFQLAKQQDAIKNQQAQQGIDDAKVKEILTSYYNQMTKDTSMMSQIHTTLTTTSDANTQKSLNDDYNKLYKDYMAVSQKYNDTVAGYANSAGNNSGSSSGAITGPFDSASASKYVGSLNPMPQSDVSSLAESALSMLGLPVTNASVSALVNIAQHESSFKPGAVNPQKVGSEHATGLMQTLPSTFKANQVQGHTNIYNPLDNMLAAVKYMTATYGGPQQAWAFWQSHSAY